MADESVKEAVEAFLQNIQVEKAADYVGRGRAYQALSDDEVRSEWAAAFKAWAHDGSMSREMDDFGAELGLRDIDLPMHLVEAEFAMVQKKIHDMGPPDDEARSAVGDEVLAFLKAKNERPN